MRATGELLVLQKLLSVYVWQIGPVPAGASLHELVYAIHPVVLVESASGYGDALSTVVLSEFVETRYERSVLQLDYEVEAVPGNHLKRYLLNLRIPIGQQSNYAITALARALFKEIHKKSFELEWEFYELSYNSGPYEFREFSDI